MEAIVVKGVVRELETLAGRLAAIKEVKTGELPLVY